MSRRQPLHPDRRASVMYAIQHIEAKRATKHDLEVLVEWAGEMLDLLNEGKVGYTTMKLEDER